MSGPDLRKHRGKRPQPQLRATAKTHQTRRQTPFSRAPALPGLTPEETDQ
jgi:hypothetical protein